MPAGQFDSDTCALEQRILSHEKYGTNDLNEWIFSILDPREGQTILDLGCGTGKQSIPLAQAVGSAGQIVSIDVSQDAVDAVERRAAELGLGGRIRTIRGSLDDVSDRVAGMAFDRIVASYSIYYVEDADRLFRTLSEATAPGGLLFFCGPSSANNSEILDFHNQVKGAPTGSAGHADLFMEGIGPRLANRYFTDVRTHHFENPIRYDSADALYAYWSSYNLYEAGMDDAFRRAAERHFESHDLFETVKRVIGISARRG